MHSLTFVDFVWDNKIKLAAGIFVIFFVVYTVLTALGLIPDSLQAAVEPKTDITVASSYATTSTTSAITSLVTQSTSTPTIKATSTAPVQKVAPAPLPTTTITNTRGGQDPVRIVIEKIGVDTKVLSPKSTSVTLLDEYLRLGAVRYPGSAGLGAGNVFIFAHSTGLRVVNNPAYKAFNNFKLLAEGDTVEAYSLDKVYTYKVERVRLADAEEVFVDLSTSRNMLTLSTCNTFGQKQERYVVEAVFTGVAPIDTEAI